MKKKVLYQLLITEEEWVRSLICFNLNFQSYIKTPYKDLRNKIGYTGIDFDYIIEISNNKTIRKILYKDKFDPYKYKICFQKQGVLYRTLYYPNILYNNSKIEFEPFIPFELNIG